MTDDTSLREIKEAVDKDTDKRESENEDGVKQEESSETKKGEKENKVDLLKVNVDSESVALNVLIGFIGLAQRRGAFAVNESAKIYEAIKLFMPDRSS